MSHVCGVSCPEATDVEPYKPVILLGGAPGAGKSTVANRLLSSLDLDHRIGTGFIRAILQSESSQTSEPLLFSRTFESDDPIGRVVWQAGRLRNAVAACVQRARNEGTSLVVEGSHLVPSVYQDLAVDVFAILAAPPEPEHARRVSGHRHTQRVVGSDGIRRIREIDEFYRLDAEQAGVPVLSTDTPVEQLVDSLTSMMCQRRHPPSPG